MSCQQEFVDSTLAAYAKLRSEITSDASEFDVRHRIIKYIIEGLLKYSGKDYQAEKNRTDVRLLDETHTLPLVIIETKKPSVDLAEGKWEEQVFGYSDAFTKFVILTNGMKIKVWSTDKRQKAIIDLDFENFASQTKLTDEHLTVAEKAQILILANLTKDELWSDKKYENFHIPNKINIVDPEGFIKLIDKIGFVQNQLLLSYMLSAFNEYTEGFLEFE